jgi:hypothetical protein
MNTKHYLVAWGYFAVYEAEIPELECPKLIDAETPDDAIALYPKQVGRGHAYVIGTVEEDDTLGVKTLAENAIPMAAYPSFCDWTAMTSGHLNGQYKRLVNNLYWSWKFDNSKEIVAPDLLRELAQLRRYKQMTEKCVEKEFQRLYDAGFVKSMMGNKETGAFSFDLNLDCTLREELAKSNYWKRYYEDKYLALLPDEERNPPPQAKEA